MPSPCRVHVDVRCRFGICNDPFGVLDHIRCGEQHLSGDWMNGFEDSKGVDGCLDLAHFAWVFVTVLPLLPLLPPLSKVPTRASRALAIPYSTTNQMFYKKGGNSGNTEKKSGNKSGNRAVTAVTFT